MMLDKMQKDIDGAAISNPDHTCIVTTMASMELSMRVFCEQSLVHKVWQARILKIGSVRQGSEYSAL